MGSFSRKFNIIANFLNHRATPALLVLRVLLAKTDQRVLVVMLDLLEDRETLGSVEPLARRERRESLEMMDHQ